MLQKKGTEFLGNDHNHIHKHDDDDDNDGGDSGGDEDDDSIIYQCLKQMIQIKHNMA